MIAARARSARVVLVAVLAIVPGACGPGAGVVATPSAAPPTSSAPATSAATASPAAPSPVEATPQQPPAATLTIGSRPAVAGAIGTYVFAGAGSDAPWLPGVALPVGRGGNAVVTLVPDIGSASWRVKRAAVDDRDGSTARTVASGDGPIAFRLDAVAGTVMLDVEYAGGQGNGTYFWRVIPG